MKLYRVYNGYNADSAVHVIVVAENEEWARDAASIAFKKEARYSDSERELTRKEYRYDERYWMNLDVELLADNLTKLYCSKVEY